MRTSKKGVAFIKGYEKFEPKVYKDQAGLPTIGWGHLIVSGEKFPKEGITKQQADELFARDLVVYEDAVNKYVKVDLKQNQFDALVALCFNIGVGRKRPTRRGFIGSAVLSHLNAGRFQLAAEAFLSWNKVTINGKKVISRGLDRRRKAEKKIFETGNYGLLTLIDDRNGGKEETHISVKPEEPGTKPVVEQPTAPDPPAPVPTGLMQTGTAFGKWLLGGYKRIAGWLTGMGVALQLEVFEKRPWLVGLLVVALVITFVWFVRKVSVNGKA